MPAAPGQHRILPKRTYTKHKAQERRGTAQERGYNARWRRFREVFLAKHPLCEYCLADGKLEAATVVDHDVPHQGDRAAFWATSFTALCSRHHSGEKRAADARYSGDDLLRWVRARKGPRRAPEGR